MNSLETLRVEIDRAIAAGHWNRAYGDLQKMAALKQSGSVAKYVLECAEQLREHVTVRAFRLFVLRSFTVEPVLTQLRAAAFVAGIDLTVQVGAFNAYAQEIFDPKSALYEFQPDAAILCVQTRDIVPELWDSFTDLTEAGLPECIGRTIEQYRSMIHSFRQQSHAHLIVHLLEQPAMPSQGVYDSQVGASQFGAIEEINLGLLRLRETFSGVFLLAYDELVSRCGRLAWHDSVKWELARMPISAQCIPQLAHEWLRFLCPLAERTSKVLVVDLDNTIWGGVAGEEGLEGVRVGKEHPGSSYLHLQRAVLDLHRRGIVLAIASKNNEADATRILEEHPEMLLRPKHFAAMRVNWNDKAQSLREIAEELNVGVDSLAFLDDNPVERERVRWELPEVRVIDLPEDPQGYAGVLRNCPFFERLAITPEDLERNRQYQEQRLRTQLARTTHSVVDYYRALNQRVEIIAANGSTFARISQLTVKTNQFNLTTRRYSEQQIRELAARGDYDVYAVQAADRFGDSGIVGVVISKTDGEECSIETFLLSCRVIARTIETAILSYLAEENRRRGIRFLRGCFIPTKKNAPAADFYSRHGFKQTAANDQESTWMLDLEHRTVECPQWITLTAKALAATGTYAAS